MSDPYAVLGIAPGADEETVKKAYRQKCKQYHPDLHPNDPAAEEKFKEVQAAYSAIMRPHTSSGYAGGGSYSSAGGYAGGGQQYQNPFGGYGFGGFGPFGFGFGPGFGGQRTYSESSPELQAAGNYIRSGYYREALNVLDNMPQNQRTARWHYYAALACNGLGDNLRALDEARAAAEMEPGNYQYQNLLTRLQNPGQAYAAGRRGYAQPGAPGSSCMSLWLYMMLCNVLSLCCCGGRGGFFCC